MFFKKNDENMNNESVKKEAEKMVKEPENDTKAEDGFIENDGENLLKPEDDLIENNEEIIPIPDKNFEKNHQNQDENSPENPQVLEKNPNISNQKEHQILEKTELVLVEKSSETNQKTSQNFVKTDQEDEEKEKLFKVYFREIELIFSLVFKFGFLTKSILKTHFSKEVLELISYSKLEQKVSSDTYFFSTVFWNLL